MASSHPKRAFQPPFGRFAIALVTSPTSGHSDSTAAIAAGLNVAAGLVFVFVGVHDATKPAMGGWPVIGNLVLGLCLLASGVFRWVVAEIGRRPSAEQRSV